MKGDLKKNHFKTKLVAAKFISLLQDESWCLGDIPRLLMPVSPTTCRLYMMGIFGVWHQRRKDVKMALMDVLRLFDLNPEKIAAITADGVPAMTGKMNRMEEKN